MLLSEPKRNPEVAVSTGQCFLDSGYTDTVQARRSRNTPLMVKDEILGLVNLTKRRQKVNRNKMKTKT